MTANNFYPILDDIIQLHLIAAAINQELATTLAQNVVDELADRFGGQTIYLRNNTQARLAKKHRQILIDFNGSNHAEIYRKYQISQTWLKKLVARAAQNEQALG